MEVNDSKLLKDIYNLLVSVSERLDTLEEKQDELIEKISNLELPGSGYGLELTE